MRIESIERKQRGRLVAVTFAGDAPLLELSAEVAHRAGLRPGLDLSPGRLAALERDDLAWRCKEAALRLLTHRQRSAAELRRRLIARQFPAAIVDACLADLERARLIDDALFADTLARERLRSKPMGKVRLRSELRAKGVDEEIADHAIDEAFDAEPEGELELARRAARKFRPRPAAEAMAERRRLYGFLARRGFTPDTISRVVDERVGSDD